MGHPSYDVINKRFVSSTAMGVLIGRCLYWRNIQLDTFVSSATMGVLDWSVQLDAFVSSATMGVLIGPS
jgi:hypothetical protein